MVISFLRMLLNLLALLVLARILLSYVLNPFHPVRVSIDRIVEPLLAPIRQIVPPIGMFDLSSLVLLILLQVIDRILIAFY